MFHYYYYGSNSSNELQVCHLESKNTENTKLRKLIWVVARDRGGKGERRLGKEKM
jgi:hypothetical protein